MYTVTIDATFSATHQLRLSDGRLEPLHGHDWHVRASFSATYLDDHGMVVDFDVAAAALHAIVKPLHHGALNEMVDFARCNPTAEAVAKFIADRLIEKGLRNVSRVEVTEAPGCIATYEPSL